MSARCSIACRRSWTIVAHDESRQRSTGRLDLERSTTSTLSPAMKISKNTVFSLGLLVCSMVVALAISEGILRVKNSSMKNYDIEMWRYARELKVKSSDPSLDFEHLKNKSAVLQNVEIRLNEWGLRGDAVPAVSPDKRRVLFLGASTTLGWGVPEEETVERR